MDNELRVYRREQWAVIRPNDPLDVVRGKLGEWIMGKATRAPGLGAFSPHRPRRRCSSGPELCVGFAIPSLEPLRK